ncbi:MAG TPA: RAMP superfamily CRISPR-associated protein [Ktedonobacteraceae bacterium]|nr:RAMP superfamily CRISPR-associated protein [Ktedonobacteraceae bacterium]
MPKPSWSGDVSRQIVRRIVVEGDLVLQTPAHFGNGDGTNLIDIPLLIDPFDESAPLLTGASIAGALRNALREREHGFRQKIDQYTDADHSASVLLFGGHKGNEYGEQSPLIVEDALGKHASIELRDGVRLEGKSRTSAEDALFMIEMWQAGTTFPLRFELIVRVSDNVSALKRALATALVGFTDGSITLGARKRRGYGQVSVTGWRVKEYDLTDPEQLLDWIAHGADKLSSPSNPKIVTVLGVNETLVDQRRAFRLTATFSLDGSLLIRSGSGPDDPDTKQAIATEAQRPDMLHLHSARLSPAGDGTRRQMPILSGTSLAGALRARAFKIARLLAPPTDAGKENAQKLVEHLFGADMQKRPEPEASRITISEQEVKKVQNTLVQQRVSIDRFTGGTREGALFSEQPLLSEKESRVSIDIHLVNPQEYEIGLLLLVMKDLWTGDLPLGGEISVGRGRLRGQHCHLEYKNGQVQSWDLRADKANGVTVTKGQPKELERYVTALHAQVDGSKA